MLEAEISTLFNLTLIELVEYAATTGIAVAIVASIIAMGSFIVSALQAKKQSKVSSANLILELLKPWRTPDLQQLLHQLTDPNTKKYDEIKLEFFLNHLESIAIFWKDETLSENHVKEFFGENLKLVRDDQFIQDYMKKYIDKNPDYFFVNLTELIKKVEEWNI